MQNSLLESHPEGEQGLVIKYKKVASSHIQQRGHFGRMLKV